MNMECRLFFREIDEVDPAMLRIQDDACLSLEQIRTAMLQLLDQFKGSPSGCTEALWPNNFLVNVHRMQ